MINSEKGIEWLIAILRKDQSPVGSWNYPFETGISTDAYMIILLRTLAINDEQLIKGLASRIISKQERMEPGSYFMMKEAGIYRLLWKHIHWESQKVIHLLKRRLTACWQ